VVTPSAWSQGLIPEPFHVLAEDTWIEPLQPDVHDSQDIVGKRAGFDAGNPRNCCFEHHGNWNTASILFNQTLAMIMGGAAIGALTGSMGSEVGANFSEIAGLGMSSYFNSMGMSAISGGYVRPSMNFGFGTMDVFSGDVDWADLKGDPMEVIGDLTAYGAIAKDAFRVQMALRGNDRSKQLFQKYGRGPHGQEGTTRHPLPTDEIPTGEEGKWDIALPYEVIDKGDENFFHIDHPSYDPETLRHMRRYGLHIKSAETFSGEIFAEAYQNYWPVQGLGGANVLFHGMFEGQTAFGLYGYGKYLYDARFAYGQMRY